MANPWEEFTATDSGPWNDFGATPAEEPSSSGLFNKINAGAEALANTAAGMVGGFTTGPLAALTNAANVGVREGRLITPSELEQAYSSGVGVLTDPLMSRTSPLGQEYTENIGKGMQELIPIAPLHGTIPSLKVGEGVRATKAALTKEQARPTTKVTALDAELTQASKPTEVIPTSAMGPFPWEEFKTTQPKGAGAFDQMARRLGVEEAPVEPNAAMAKMVEDLQFKTPEARAADIAAELRNAEQEFAVKKQTTLDMNAAERARQEAAPLPSVLDQAKPAERWVTAAPEAGLTATRTLEEQAARPNANAQFAGPGHYITTSNDLASVYGGPKGRMYHVEEPFTKPYDLAEHKAEYAALVKALGSKAEANKAIQVNGYDAITFTDPRGNKIANIFEAKPLKDIGPAREVKQYNKELSLIPKSQKGVLYLGENKKKIVGDIKANKPLSALLPELVSVADTPEGVVKATQGLPDVGNNVVQKATRLFTKGFLYEKFKTNNPIVKYTYDTISKAIDAGKEINHKLLQQDLLPKLRKLDATELTELHGAMLSAMKNKSELSRELLAKHGFNEKQIQTWESFKTAYKTSLDNLNNARALMGKDPVDPYVGYMAGMATGDFRTPIIKKGTGEAPQVVGIIGGNNKYTNSKRVANFLKEHPEYEAGKEQFYGAGASRGERGSALVEALSLLSDNDPNIKEFSHALSDHLQNTAYDYQGAKKHTMQKKGVFGMEGSKPWESAEQNALDGFRAQIRYIETMSKWSELSKATQQLKEVFSNPEIQESQRNALDMSKQYLNNALGNNPMEFGRWLDKGVGIIGKNLGLGPSYFDSAIRGVRGGINTIFFALKPTFLAANAIQGMVSTPKMVNFLRGRGFDVAALDKTGLSQYMKSGIDGLNHVWAKEQTPFAKDMWKYGEAHGISSTQIFEHSTDIRQGVSHAASSVLESGMGVVEGVPRSMMYAMFSNILKDNGYAKHPDIFKVARELTDMSMGDYRAHEGQKINQAAGPLAPLLGNLSTFAGNENSMIALLAREAKNNKSYAPIVAAIMTGLLVHGIMGFPGFDEANKLYEFISTKMGKPSTLTNEVLTMASKEGKMGDVLAMGMPAYAGIDTHQVLGRSSALPAIFGGGGAGKAVDIGAAALNVAGNPTNEMAWKRAAYEGALGAMKGPMDLTWFSQGDIAMNKKEGHATEGQYKRSQFDKNARLAGLFSVPESKAKEAVYQQSLQDKHYKEMQQKAINYLGDKKVSSKGLRQEDISEGLDRYIAAEGDPTKFANEIVKFGININTTAMQRYLIAKAQSGNISAVKALQRMSEKTYAE